MKYYKCFQSGFTPLETAYSKRRSLMGFTLAEVIVTIIIIAVLASLAYPRFVRSIEITTGREAMIGLELMISAEKIVRMQTGAFVVCNQPFVPGSDDCNTQLNLDLRLVDWGYLCLDSAGTFMCGAVRTSGPESSGILILDENGTFCPSPPGCTWQFWNLL